jgi:aminopeptidase N
MADLVPVPHMHIIIRLLAAAIFPALATAWSEEPFAFEKTPGQLPKSVVPRHYAIRIEPDLEAGTLRGEETIEIDVRKPVRQLILNSLGLEISDASLLGAAETALTPRLDEARQTVTLALPHQLIPGKYEIRLRFRGKLSERPQGLYITRYQAGGEQKRALATQMEATDARRMFPCWDEPVYRATFQLTAVVPQKHVAVSNMPIEREGAVGDERKEVVFAKTPSMVTYLVAFAAGDFEELRDEIDGVQLRIFTTEGKREQARYAMESTKKILPFYNEYFGTKYPLPKLDQLAFPSTGASGMENWGAIVYNDLALLYDPATSSNDTKQRVFKVVAHEIAHQWFGDLVTMAWWDNLWLNEGFASWMGTKATDHFNPEWKSWLRAAGDKEFAMRLDARATTHPIQQPVTNEAEANDAFDEITYSKGQSFLRMLESWLGEAKFRDGIRAYMKRHAYSSTTTADLWTALEKASGQPVRGMAKGWTEQPGFPVVMVKRASGDGALALTQQRFTIHQNRPKPLQWKIPVVLGGALEPDKARVVLLEGKTRTTRTESGSPAKINIGDVGYYRAEYADDAGLRMPLERIVAKLTEADRLNLLNDAWALVQANRAPIERYLNLVATLANDDSPVIVGQFVETIAFIDHLRRPGKTDDLFTRWAIALLRAHLDRLGWEPRAGESPLDAQLRGALINILGKLDDERVRTVAFERFGTFVKEPSSLPGDLRDAVLSIVGRFGDASQHAQLHEVARKVDSFELKRALYAAMASAQDATLVQDTLKLALTDELIPTEAARLVQRVAGADEHPDLAWTFAKNNLEALHAKVSSLTQNEYVPDLFRVFHETQRADELESFARAKLPPATAPNVAKAADEIRFKAELKTRILPKIEAWCREHVENGGKQPPP